MADYWDQFDAHTAEEPNRVTQQAADPYGGKTGAALANDPTYILSEINRAYQQRYGRDATPEEMQTQFGYATKPDTYSDGTVHQGMNPYLFDRIATPGHEGASDPRLAGTDTLVQGGGAQAPGGFSSAPNGNLASFSAPGLAAPYTQEFKPVDAQSIANSPAYQFRMQQGMDALQRSAASKGTLLTGGTLKDLAGFSQGLASTEFDNQFKRDFDTYGLNRGTYWGNQNNAYDKLSGFTQLGQQGANTLGNFGTGYSNRTTDIAAQQGNNDTAQGSANGNAVLAGTNAGNSTGSYVANTLGSIDWSKLFNRKTAGATGGP